MAHVAYQLLRDKMRRTREAISLRVAQNLSLAMGQAVTQFTNDQGRVMYLHRSARYPKKWQLTWCDNRGPSGHTEFDDQEEAIRSASGEFTKSGPPYGSRDYKVTETRP